VPIDDHNNWAWSFDYHPARALKDSEVQAMKDGQGVHVKYLPGTYIPLQNKANNYLMDRAAQKAGTRYSGIEGIAMQDASLQESMGAIQDRTKENLVGTDNGIIMMRQRLMKAAKALADQGTPPPGTEPEHQKVRSAAVLLKRGLAFQEAARDALRAVPGTRQTSV
jgi:hypothetical protein